jgi:hypothetical protein
MVGTGDFSALQQLSNSQEAGRPTQKTRSWRPASPRTTKLDLSLNSAVDFWQSFSELYIDTDVKDHKGGEDISLIATD